MDYQIRHLSILIESVTLTVTIGQIDEGSRFLESGAERQPSEL
jgi:hypothetical protein